MKTSSSFVILLVVLFASIIYGCNETTIIEPTPDIKGDCSAISDTISDVVKRIIAPLHPVKYAHASSLKGTHLLYSTFLGDAVYHINTKSGLTKYVDFQSMLPSDLKFEYFNNAVFCPYDDDVFMVHLSVSNDTVGNSQKYTLGYHIFIFNANENTLSLVTPAITGKFGNKFGLGAWELSSNNNNNNIFLFPFGYVNLENNKVIHTISMNNLIQVSPNGKDIVHGNSYYNSKGISLYEFHLNNIELDIDSNHWTEIPEGFHFSHDGKYLLFTTSIKQTEPWVLDPNDPQSPPKDTIPYAQRRFIETFIVDVEKTKDAGKMVLHNIVRYRRDLCLTGVYWHARFLTPRSYVISYRYNNTELHQLHEISIDGKILGQVTR